MPRLYAVDASFLAGECDPAVVARLDDVVRANAAGRIRNGYVRSMGGVHTRPGMRVALAIEGREFDPVEDLPRAQYLWRLPGFGTTVLRTAAFGSHAIILPWPVSDEPPQRIPEDVSAVVLEIDLGQTLPAGTTITVPMRLSGNAPDGWTQRLCWWEHNPEHDDLTDGTPPVGRWRSGAGHGGGRVGRDDLALIRQKAFADFTHELVSAADKVRLRARPWRPTGGGGVAANEAGAYAIEINQRGITGQYQVGVGEAGGRPTARLLNATWFATIPRLLALHGTHATLLEGTEANDGNVDPARDTLREVQEEGPRSFTRYTGFSPEEVRTMQAHPAPDGLYMHSPTRGFWPPRRLRYNGGTQRFELEDVPISGDIPGLGEAIGPGSPPSVVYPHQGRLIP